jgi:thiol-disulfide isomerase/thioredoxin
MKNLLQALALSSILVACTEQIHASHLLESNLLTSSGDNLSLGAQISSERFTILEFFSADCPVQRSHDRRLVQLHEQYRSRGVGIVAIDSESVASPVRDAAEARNRGFPFPILIDKGARIADILHAEYSTFSVIVDRDGRTRYAGGIDSDHSKLNSDSVPYLRNAIDDLLAGNEPRQARTKSLGCTLQKW